MGHPREYLQSHVSQKQRDMGHPSFPTNCYWLSAFEMAVYAGFF